MASITTLAGSNPALTSNDTSQVNLILLTNNLSNPITIGNNHLDRDIELSNTSI